MSFSNETPHFELHLIRRCVMCNRDVAHTDDCGLCPGCAKES